MVLYLNSSPSSQPRTQSGSSPELVSLETPANIMKLLSENISSSHPQEALELNSKLSPLGPPSVPQNPLPLTPSADTYDKQVINNIFDSLLSQKWPAETAFPEATTEVSLQPQEEFFLSISQLVLSFVHFHLWQCLISPFTSSYPPSISLFLFVLFIFHLLTFVLVLP